MMRWMALAAFLWLSTGAAAHDTFYTYRAEVVSVYDGDTATVNIDLGFEVWMNGQALRFYCINTPEVRGFEREDGLRVRDLVREWLPPGSMITLESVQDKSGKFGRWLAIITPDGWDESVNARLYREGHARIEAYSASGMAKCMAVLG